MRPSLPVAVVASAVSADGAVEATVSTPEGFRPYAVRNGRVWGVYEDELDVESVRAYRIEKGEG